MLLIPREMRRMRPGMALLLEMERVPMLRPAPVPAAAATPPGVTASWMSPLLHLAEWEEPAPLHTGPLTQRTL